MTEISGRCTDSDDPPSDAGKTLPSSLADAPTKAARPLRKRLSFERREASGSELLLSQVELIQPSTAKGAPTEAFDVVVKGRQPRTYTFSPTSDEPSTWLKPLCSIVPASAVSEAYSKWRLDELVLLAMAAHGDASAAAPSTCGSAKVVDAVVVDLAAEVPSPRAQAYLMCSSTLLTICTWASHITPKSAWRMHALCCLAGGRLACSKLRPSRGEACTTRGFKIGCECNPRHSVRRGRPR